MKQKTYKKHFILLSVLLIVLFFLNISLGSVSIPFKEIFYTLVVFMSNFDIISRLDLKAENTIIDFPLSVSLS